MAAQRPPFVRRVQKKHPNQRVEVWFQDEARFGQQGTMTRVWAKRGSRPTQIKQTEYQWVYLFGAVNPLTGDSVGLVAPTVNTFVMNAHLRMIGEHVGRKRHVVLVMDQAGWHVAKDLDVPTNITLFLLPPYSPELNPIERLWHWLRDHQLSNHVYIDYDDLFDSGCRAWNTLTPERLQTVCATSWIKGTN